MNNEIKKINTQTLITKEQVQDAVLFYYDSLTEQIHNYKNKIFPVKSSLQTNFIYSFSLDSLNRKNYTEKIIESIEIIIIFFKKLMSIEIELDVLNKVNITKKYYENWLIDIEYIGLKTKSLKPIAEDDSEWDEFLGCNINEKWKFVETENFKVVAFKENIENYVNSFFEENSRLKDIPNYALTLQDEYNFIYNDIFSIMLSQLSNDKEVLYAVIDDFYKKSNIYIVEIIQGKEDNPLINMSENLNIDFFKSIEKAEKLYLNEHYYEAMDCIFQTYSNYVAENITMNKKVEKNKIGNFIVEAFPNDFILVNQLKDFYSIIKLRNDFKLSKGNIENTKSNAVSKKQALLISSMTEVQKKYSARLYMDILKCMFNLINEIGKEIII